MSAGSYENERTDRFVLRLVVLTVSRNHVFC